jgi:hypothetical protein
MKIPIANSDHSIAADTNLFDKPERQKFRLSFSLATLFWAITTIVLLLTVGIQFRQKQIALDEVQRLEELIDADSTIQVDYGRIILFRVGRDLFALRFAMPSGNDLQSVSYEWTKVADQSSLELGNKTEWTKGIAQEHEQWRGFDSAAISVGPLTMEWSQGNATVGWLYLSTTRQNGSYGHVRFDMYRDQFDELSQLSQLDDRLWKPVRIDN